MGLALRLSSVAFTLLAVVLATQQAQGLNIAREQAGSVYVPRDEAVTQQLFVQRETPLAYAGLALLSAAPSSTSTATASSSTSSSVAVPSATNGYQSFDSLDYRKTLNLSQRLANHSWEFGTTSEATLEVYNPELTVYSKKAFPNGQLPQVANGGQSTPALKYARPNINLTGDTLSNGDGALGDPASLGNFALLLGVAKNGDAAFKQAADRQLQHLLAGKRWPNGAISQRENVAELWADGTFMMFPFIAYYGAGSNNASMVQLAVDQLGLYRDALHFPTTAPWNGLWSHIVGPQAQTLGIWATGNGWAALAIVRVLGVVQNWSGPNDYEWKTLQAQLTTKLVGLAMEIFNALGKVSTDRQTGLLRNYIVGNVNDPTDESTTWFGDGSGTAALVAAALRLAVLQPTYSQQLISLTKPWRAALANRTDRSSGLLAPTVDPLDWYTTNPYLKGSPEGQAFVSMAGAAWRDCKQAGVCKNGQ